MSLFVSRRDLIILPPFIRPEYTVRAGSVIAVNVHRDVYRGYLYDRYNCSACVENSARARQSTLGSRVTSQVSPEAPFSMRTDSNSAGHLHPRLRRRRLYNCSKIRAVNDSVRVLRETFCSRRGVVKLFTTPIRRYNGAAGWYIGRLNERTNGPEISGRAIYLQLSTVTWEILANFAKMRDYANDALPGAGNARERRDRSGR